MSRVSDKFKELKQKRRKALITYITAGDPSLAMTQELVSAISSSGAEIIELGVPFSDPLADGPTIQASHMRALNKNISLADVFGVVKKIRAKSQIPIVLMISYNLILKYGIDKFVKNAKSAGVDGVIPPDLSFDEAKALLKASGGLDLIFLVSPTSSDDRIRSIAEISSGFIYLLSLTGITGARNDLPEDIKTNVLRIKKYIPWVSPSSFKLTSWKKGIRRFSGKSAYSKFSEML